MSGGALKAFSGYFAAARAGRTCLDRSPRTSLVGDASSSGPATGGGTRLGASWWSSLIGGAMSIGNRASPTARSPRQKKGRSDRADQAGQGNQAHAPGRRRGPAAGDRHRER